MSEPTSSAASNAVVTTTQKVFAVIGGAGMGVSLADVTAWLQAVGALTGAIVGVWMVADKCIALFFGKRAKK